MIDATEYFAGLFADGFQPILVYSREKDLCYRNPPADSIMALWGIEDPSAFLTPAVSREAEFCMNENRGSALSEKICDRVVPLQLLPQQLENDRYLVVQVCFQPASPQEEQLRHVLRNAHAKLASYMNQVYGVAQELGIDSPVGGDIARNVRRVLRMTGHLYLWMDRSGRYQYRVPVNVGDYLTQFVRIVNECYPEMRLAAAPFLSDLFARVMPEDLELVLGTLVSNAQRFGNGVTRIMAYKQEDRVLIECWDNGPGVKEPDRLFEVGYRTPDRKGSMGLGFSLNIAKELLALQGATLEYERKDNQTCFRISLMRETMKEGMLAEWDFERGNSLSQLRLELSDI